MNIIQFLDEVGHTKLTFQVLNECIKGATTRRGHTEVRFGTQMISPNDLIGPPSKVGIILWMSKEDFDRAAKTVGGA